MNNFGQEAEQLLIERFWKGTIITLATTKNETAYNRRCHERI